MLEDEIKTLVFLGPDCDKVDLFESFRNFDGTYDGVGFMSALTSVPQSEVRAIWEKMKADKAERDA